VDIRAVFEKPRVIPMATADRTDHPNVILVGMWFWADEEILCVSENYLNKAKKTSRRTPRSPSTAERTGRTTLSRGRFTSRPPVPTTSRYGGGRRAVSVSSPERPRSCARSKKYSRETTEKGRGRGSPR
jgi:hypothetical protein